MVAVEGFCTGGGVGADGLGFEGLPWVCSSLLAVCFFLIFGSWISISNSIHRKSILQSQPYLSPAKLQSTQLNNNT
jgi:hypothetical protein